MSLFAWVIPAFAISLPLFVAVLATGAAALNHRRRLSARGEPLPRVLWLLSAMNLLATFMWIMVLLEVMPLGRRLPLSDYGAPISAVALLVMVPVGLPILHWLKGKSEIARTVTSLRLYAVVSNMFLIVSTIPGALVVLFYAMFRLGASR